jgi:hypothetical protein
MGAVDGCRSASVMRELCAVGCRLQFGPPSQLTPFGLARQNGSQRREEYRADSQECPAYRGDRMRFIVRADEKLTAFLELESAIRSCAELS